jgi:hypothetical protein
VKLMLKHTNLYHCFDSIKEWYKGYRIGHSTLYNPWSINNCLMDNGELQPYWVHTSDNSLTKSLLMENSFNMKEDLLEGKRLTKISDRQMTLKDIGSHNTAIWTLFYYTGYLTTSKKYLNEYLSGEYVCEMVIPNREVRTFYEEIIAECLRVQPGVLKT